MKSVMFLAPISAGTLVLRGFFREANQPLHRANKCQMKKYIFILQFFFICNSHGLLNFFWQFFYYCRTHHLHCNENPIYVFPEKELRGLIPNFHIHVSVSDLQYIFLGSVRIFSCSKIGRQIVGIYKSLTDPWIWKLDWGNSFSEHICFKFSVLCLCSV